MVQPGLAARGAPFRRCAAGSHLVGIGLILAGVVTLNVLAGSTDA